MQGEFRRHSDRISLAVPIEVTGTDVTGRSFRDKTRTLTISRNGAKIPLARPLNPDQALTIHCLGTGRDATARVVWRSQASPEGYFYGLEILQTGANLWGIDFPPPAETELAAGRVLLECASCHTLEVVYLNNLDLELFEMNRRVAWPCKRCNDMTTWREPSLRELLDQPTPPTSKPDLVLPQPPPAPPARTENERIEPRLSLKITGCVQSARHGEDVVATENVSDSGFCFKSAKPYEEGTMIEAALPYLKQGGNVFIPSQIVWARKLPQEAETVYGVWYARDRRRAKRVRVIRVIAIGLVGAGIRVTGDIVDLSMKGALVKCSGQLNVGTFVRLGIGVGQEIVRVAAVVRRSVPGVGPAFEFIQMAHRDRALLRRLILRLETPVAT